LKVSGGLESKEQLINLTFSALRINARALQVGLTWPSTPLRPHIDNDAHYAYICRTEIPQPQWSVAY